MKRIIIGLIILAVLGGGGYWLYRQRQAADTQHFTTVALEKGTVEQTVTATGTLAAVTAVNVGSEVSGVIQTLYVDYNSTVKKGQLLAQINPETLQAQVDKAKASLDKTRAQYESAVAQARSSQASVDKAAASMRSAEAKYRQALSSVENSRATVRNSRAAVANAEAMVRKSKAECDNAQINYQRLEKLYAQDLIAHSERDDAYTSYRSALASLEASQASLRSSQANLSGSEATLRSSEINLEALQADLEAARIQISAARDELASAQSSVNGARADVKQGQANLDSAKVDLSKTSIRSPIDGVVLSVLVSEGQTVAAQYQAPELFKLAQNLNEMQVETTVDEADIGSIKSGDPVTFTVDAWPDREFKGSVLEVRKSATTTNNVVTYPVIVKTDNPDMCLMPGMTATVSIATARAEDVALIPNGALRFKPEDDSAITNPESKEDINAAAEKKSDKAKDQQDNQKVIFILDRQDPNKIERHMVETGLTDGTNTQVIKSDLPEGARIVTGSATGKPKTESGKRNRRGGPPF